MAQMLKISWHGVGRGELEERPDTGNAFANTVSGSGL